jgi:putative transposase
MDGHLRISARERKPLLDAFRAAATAEERLRWNAVLLWADGYRWDLIAAVLFCSTATVARWVGRYRDHGLAGVAPVRPPRYGNWWTARVLVWIQDFTPTHFHLVRSRWTCAVLVVLLARECQVQVSRETVRRRLRQHDLVWRRPRPVLRGRDPKYARKLRKIRRLLAELAADELALFQDEVEVCTNPKVGGMWMPRGQQALLLTPGTNKKRHLVGSLAWGSCRLVTTWADRRDSAAFLAHLDCLRRTYRCYRRVHVICDNASFHKSRAVRAYLKKHPRVRLHYLPTQAPETNPVERVWWHLHEEVTRNHTCLDLDALVSLVERWLRLNQLMPIETSIYSKNLAKTPRLSAA